MGNLAWPALRFGRNGEFGLCTSSAELDEVLLDGLSGHPGPNLAGDFVPRNIDIFAVADVVDDEEQVLVVGCCVWC